jgi:UDP-3-O-[3-hydroxymyristoyl] glucosamine N-acyltransferase
MLETRIMQKTLSELAAAVAGELTGDGNLPITRAVHPADATGATDLAVAMDKRYVSALADTKAVAAIVTIEAEVPSNITHIIRVPWAKRALVELTNIFATPWHYEPGIHAAAVISPLATVGNNVSVGPFCYVGPHAVIGDNTVLQAHAYVGAHARIGGGGFIFSGARIMDGVQIGDRAIIHPNAVIGADGFSFVSAEKGSVEAFKEGRTNTGGNNHLLRIASLGPVVVGDDVEIGAGTTIDRATLRTTRIGSGTKIDNQVQVGHNATIGQNVMICGQAGVAGSSTIGDRVVLAASSGVADNVQIGDDAMVGAAAGVAGNVPARTIVMGTPAMPRERFQDLIMAQARLPRLMKQVEELKDRIKTLEDSQKTT